jgi:hypothetical protein
MYHRSLRRVVPLILALVAVTACEDDATSPSPQEGRVRAIHAIGNAPAVDVLADGAVAVSALTFGNKSAYASLSAAAHTITVRATGQTAALLAATPTVAVNTDYTFVAAGRLGATTGPTPRLIAITDAATPAAGQASIRVVHASPAAGNVDVYATAPGADIATATPVLTNVAFGAVAAPLNVAAGTYRFRVTPAGTKTVAIDVNNVAVTAGKFVAVAVGDNAPITGAASAFSILLFAENSN